MGIISELCVIVKIRASLDVWGVSGEMRGEVPEHDVEKLLIRRNAKRGEMGERSKPDAGSRQAGGGEEVLISMTMRGAALVCTSDYR